MVGGMKKILFIFNPKSGKAQMKNYLIDILDIFIKQKYEVTVHPTQSPLDALNIVKEKSAQYDMLVCSGGDGTLAEVVEGIIKAKKHIPIGYIPSGSTNDFATSLGIPKNMKQAAEIITREKRFSCDVGKFNENIFVYIAAFGIFTDVSYETNQGMKNILGHMAYILEGMKRLSAIKSYHLNIKYDTEELEGDFLFGMITNSLSVGGFKTITGKDVQFDDGVFEVTLIKKPNSPMEINKLMSALVLGDVDGECMHCFKTSYIEFSSQEEIAWTLDGEFGGEVKQACVKNMQKAIELIVP